MHSPNPNPNSSLGNPNRVPAIAAALEVFGGRLPDNCRIRIGSPLHLILMRRGPHPPKVKVRVRVKVRTIVFERRSGDRT